MEAERHEWEKERELRLQEDRQRDSAALERERFEPVW
jgi:hypothetical protein